MINVFLRKKAGEVQIFNIEYGKINEFNDNYEISS
jgi:hypothetical protein